MANLLLSQFCAGGLVLALSLAASGQNDGEPPELLLDSESLTFDGQTNLFKLGGLEITQGNLRIEADEAQATGIDFAERSEWHFTGNVRITVDTAVIGADSAIFAFDNKRLSRGELLGAPVSFTHLEPERAKPVIGTADRMVYDHLARTLRMQNGRLERDRTEIRGCDLIYNFTTEGIASGDANCENPFRLRVLPDPDEQTSAPAPQ
jgi:lipopolysaccharide transport protein LptA